MKKAGDAITPEYRDWRNRFLWQRLHLWFWLALMCLLTFTIRDIYDFFFPLKDLAVPKELRNQGLVIHAVMFCSILTCLAIHKTKFGRRRPGLLFLGLSWSITLVEQIFGTINGFALPNIIAWSLVFLSQATFMPVRWALHLTSQLVVLAYFFGVNTALGLKFPVSGKPIYDVTFILFLFWFCFICDFGVYLYDRLQRSEFYARLELETAYQKLEAAEAGLIEDITKRKLAEAALQEQFDFLHVLINTIPAPVFYKNAQGLFVGCNLVFEESMGVSKEQIIGKTVYDLAPLELADQYHQADMALFERRGVQTYESSVVYKDGKKHDVIFYKATFSKADGTLGGLVGVILDISDRKRTEEALRVFFHAVSHDLRNPVLGTLMVLRNLLNRGGGQGDRGTRGERKGKRERGRIFPLSLSHSLTLSLSHSPISPLSQSPLSPNSSSSLNIRADGAK